MSKKTSVAIDLEFVAKEKRNNKRILKIKIKEYVGEEFFNFRIYL
jgi:hypothetical protein